MLFTASMILPFWSGWDLNQNLLQTLWLKLQISYNTEFSVASLFGSCSCMSWEGGGEVQYIWYTNTSVTILVEYWSRPWPSIINFYVLIGTVGIVVAPHKIGDPPILSTVLSIHATLGGREADNHQVNCYLAVHTTLAVRRACSRWLPS